MKWVEYLESKKQHRQVLNAFETIRFEVRLVVKAYGAVFYQTSLAGIITLKER